MCFTLLRATLLGCEELLGGFHSEIKILADSLGTRHRTFDETCGPCSIRVGCASCVDEVSDIDDEARMFALSFCSGLRNLMADKELFLLGPVLEVEMFLKYSSSAAFSQRAHSGWVMFLSRKVGFVGKIGPMYLTRHNGNLENLIYERHQMLLFTPDSEKLLGALCEDAPGRAQVLRFGALQVNTFNGTT